jgi:hypothetical protein
VAFQAIQEKTIHLPRAWLERFCASDAKLSTAGFPIRPPLRQFAQQMLGTFIAL